MEKLTKAQLRERAPSIFTEYPDSKVSNRYQFVSSENVVDKFYELGWHANVAKQTTNSVHAKHVIRFRQNDARELDGVFPEAVFYNSHNRSCRAVLAVGFFRIVCSNGLIVVEDDNMSGKLAKIHTGKNFSIEESILNIVSSFNEKYELIQKMNKVELTHIQKISIARQTMYHRFPKTSEITPEHIITPRRKEDEGNNLWQVFNVIQENLIKGGLTYPSSKKEVTTKEIRSVYRELRINKELWAVVQALLVHKI